jgi:hypothetical protein
MPISKMLPIIKPMVLSYINVNIVIRQFICGAIIAFRICQIVSVLSKTKNSTWRSFQVAIQVSIYGLPVSALTYSL